MSSLNKLIETLFIELEQLANEYDELTDTDVREALHVTLNYFYVWGKESHQLPISYGMFSLEGDQAIAQIVNRFLTAINASSEVIGIPVGKARLELLQNRNFTTTGGCQYDEFIGHVDEPLPPSLPKYLFEVGDYDS